MEDEELVMAIHGPDFCTRYKVKKPPFPYNAGFEMLLLPHKPPQPVEPTYVSFNIERSIERISVHPLTRCFMHPPAAGTAISGEPLCLRIVAALEARDGRTSQVFLAETINNSKQADGSTTTAANESKNADAAAKPAQRPRDASWPSPPQPGEHIVAKIFDPLYHDHDERSAGPFLLADATYAQEAAAYAKLAKLHGGVVPRYYGSYSLSVHEPSVAAARTVRVVLMEYVRGRALHALDPAHFSQSARDSIIGDIIDAETAVFAQGVLYHNLVPRSVLVVGPLLSSSSEPQPPSLLLVSQRGISATKSNSQQPDQKPVNRHHTLVKSEGGAGLDSGGEDGLGGRTSSVVLIDFAQASVQNGLAQWPFNEALQFLGIHIPPLLRWHEVWWSDHQQAFEAWINWEWQPWLRERYWCKHGDITEEMRRHFLPKELLEQHQKPRRGRLLVASQRYRGS
jgi:hypothetical protein